MWKNEQHEKIKVELDEEELDFLIEAMKQMRDSDEFYT
jgi:hypothetical protein